MKKGPPKPDKELCTRYPPGYSVDPDVVEVVIVVVVEDTIFGWALW